MPSPSSLRRLVRSAAVAAFLCLPLAIIPARAEGIHCQERSEQAMELGIRISGATNVFRVVGDQPLALYTAPADGCQPPQPLALLPGTDVIAYVLHKGYTAILWNPPESSRPGVRWVRSKGLRATGYGIAPR